MALSMVKDGSMTRAITPELVNSASVKRLKLVLFMWVSYLVIVA
jgi:hypothetical protein